MSGEKGSGRLAVLLAMAMFVLVVDTSLMNVSIASVVSDEDWMRPALGALSFLLPGKAKGFPSRELAEAKAWLAADSD